MRSPGAVSYTHLRQYQCEQVNYDTFISYPQLDTWAAHSDFQSRISTPVSYTHLSALSSWLDAYRAENERRQEKADAAFSATPLGNLINKSLDRCV